MYEIKEAKAVNLNGGELKYNADLLDDARRYFSSPCQFVIGVTDYSIFPPAEIAEFAFIGRSNVGKSSLLNALVNHKGLARVSVTPGRTQQVNFFQLGDKANKALMLVDLPGYGFAKAPKNLVKAWERMSLGYLKNRKSLKRLFLLIDARHGFKKNDLDFMNQLEKFGIVYQIILTKLDKTNKEQVKAIIAFAKENSIYHASMFPDIVLCSSKVGYGIAELRNYIYNSLLS